MKPLQGMKPTPARVNNASEKAKIFVGLGLSEEEENILLGEASQGLRDLPKYDSIDQSIKVFEESEESKEYKAREQKWRETNLQRILGCYDKGFKEVFSKLKILDFDRNREEPDDVKKQKYYCIRQKKQNIKTTPIVVDENQSIMQQVHGLFKHREDNLQGPFSPSDCFALKGNGRLMNCIMGLIEGNKIGALFTKMGFLHLYQHELNRFDFPETQKLSAISQAEIEVAREQSYDVIKDDSRVYSICHSCYFDKFHRAFTFLNQNKQHMTYDQQILFLNFLSVARIDDLEPGSQRQQYIYVYIPEHPSKEMRDGLEKILQFLGREDMQRLNVNLVLSSVADKILPELNFLEAPKNGDASDANPQKPIQVQQEIQQDPVVQKQPQPQQDPVVQKQPQVQKQAEAQKQPQLQPQKKLQRTLRSKSRSRSSSTSNRGRALSKKMIRRARSSSAEASEMADGEGVEEIKPLQHGVQQVQQSRIQQPGQIQQEDTQQTTDLAAQQQGEKLLAKEKIQELI